MRMQNAIAAIAVLVGGSARASGTVTLTNGGSTSPQTAVIDGAAITDTEIDSGLGESDDDLLLANGAGGDSSPLMHAAVNRSIAGESGAGRAGDDSPRALSNPQLVRSFDGVNFHDQRFSNGGNQFSV